MVSTQMVEPKSRLLDKEILSALAGRPAGPGVLMHGTSKGMAVCIFHVKSFPLLSLSL